MISAHLLISLLIPVPLLTVLSFFFCCKYVKVTSHLYTHPDFDLNLAVVHRSFYMFQLPPA